MVKRIFNPRLFQAHRLNGFKTRRRVSRLVSGKVQGEANNSPFPPTMSGSESRRRQSRLEGKAWQFDGLSWGVRREVDSIQPGASQTIVHATHGCRRAISIGVVDSRCSNTTLRHSQAEGQSMVQTRAAVNLAGKTVKLLKHENKQEATGFSVGRPHFPCLFRRGTIFPISVRAGFFLGLAWAEQGAIHSLTGGTSITE